MPRVALPGVEEQLQSYLVEPAQLVIAAVEEADEAGACGEVHTAAELEADAHHRRRPDRRRNEGGGGLLDAGTQVQREPVEAAAEAESLVAAERNVLVPGERIREP